MNNCFKFYQNKECEYFPCHETAGDNFNCMFCYCPLYPLGDKCGGNFNYIDGKIKDCSNCLIPHSENGYEHVSSKINDVLNLARENHNK